MREKWIVCKEGLLLPLFLRKVNSYDKKSYKTTIIKLGAHKYSSENNAKKAALAFGGFVEKIIEN